MLCPNCGAECGEEIRLCENCRSLRDEQIAASEESRQEAAASGEVPTEACDLPYSGFWLRVCSFLVDAAIMSIVSGILSFVFSILLHVSFTAFFTRLFTPSNLNANFIAMWIIGLLVEALAITAFILLVAILYNVLFECSSWQATPGKRFAGTIVTDLDGHRISFGRALVRDLMKFVSAIIFCLGYLFPLFTERKQTLHDLVSGCVVRIKEEKPPFRLIVASVLALVLFIPAVRVQSKQSRSGGGRVIHIDRSTDFRPRPTPYAMPGRSATPAPAPTPAPQPTPAPEEPPEQFSGPHARIRANMSRFDAGSIVAFYYPANNSVAIGFYPEEISPAEIEKLKVRGVLARSGDHNRPLMTMNLDLATGSAGVTEKSLMSYTVNFYQDPMHHFTFDSVNDAVSFGKTKSQIAAEDKWHISGTLAPGGRLRITTRGKGAPKTSSKLNFRWDIDQEVVLFGTK